LRLRSSSNAHTTLVRSTLFQHLLKFGVARSGIQTLISCTSLPVTRNKSRQSAVSPSRTSDGDQNLTAPEGCIIPHGTGVSTKGINLQENKMNLQLTLDFPKNEGKPIISLEQFENETGLALDIFVDMASDQLWRFFEHAPNAVEITDWNRSDGLFDAISQRIRSIYSNNTRFRKKCLAADPRQHVRVFVQHWVSSLFVDKFPMLKSKIPHDYFVGVPLPAQAIASFSM
jgi:hypothetical protein